MKKTTIADIERTIDEGQTHEILLDGSFVPKKVKKELTDEEIEFNLELGYYYGDVLFDKKESENKTKPTLKDVERQLDEEGKMESKLSEWLNELARGLKEGFIKVDDNLINNLKSRAKEACELEEKEVAISKVEKQFNEMEQILFPWRFMGDPETD